MASVEGGDLIPLGDLLARARDLSNIARNKAIDFAPIGWTGQLRDSIEAGPPEIRGDALVLTLTAGARSADGEEYAEKQHDIPLRHTGTEGRPFTKGFADFAPPLGEPADDDKRGPGERKYWAGYRAERGNANKFATQFLERGADEAIDEYGDELLGGL